MYGQFNGGGAPYGGAPGGQPNIYGAQNAVPGPSSFNAGFQQQAPFLQGQFAPQPMAPYGGGAPMQMQMPMHNMQQALPPQQQQQMQMLPQPHAAYDPALDNPAVFEHVFRENLVLLTFNSKQIIDGLTRMADTHKGSMSATIAKILDSHIVTVSPRPSVSSPGFVFVHSMLDAPPARAPLLPDHALLLLLLLPVAPSPRARCPSMLFR